MNTLHKQLVSALVLLLIFTIVSCNRAEQIDVSTDLNQEQAEPIFDEKLASELGADNYGMKQYVIAFLKAGPNRDMDEDEAIKIQRAHLDNIRRMAESGDLVLAGPFMDDGEIRGIYLFNVSTIEEARSLTETDPAIEAGRLQMELHPWYGSAALLKVNEIHASISKESP
ncbi:MAG TPA: YciI family protein [Balneolaceae bacterium]|nr:YciI family protein [Balneolaceae bacterium]